MPLTDFKFNKIYAATLFSLKFYSGVFQITIIEFFTYQLIPKKAVTIEALHGCLAKSMVLLDALSCFSRSLRFSAFFLAPVFFLGIFPPFYTREQRRYNCLIAFAILNKLRNLFSLNFKLNTVILMVKQF